MHVNLYTENLKEKIFLQPWVEVNIKIILKVGRRMYSSGLRYGPVAGFCEQSNGPTSFLQESRFLKQVGVSFLKKGSAI
jgi:hypothetical protein